MPLDASTEPRNVVYVHGWQGAFRRKRGFDDDWLGATLGSVGSWSGAAYYRFVWGDRGKIRSVAPPLDGVYPAASRASRLEYVMSAVLGDFGASVHKASSDRVSRDLVEALSNMDGPTDIVAHSLGTRVVYEALRSDAASELRVRNVYLLGGAMPAALSWWRVLRHLSGKIYCLGSRRDKVLKLYYETYLVGKYVTPREWGTSRPGRAIGHPTGGKTHAGQGISTRLGRIVNVDCTTSVPTHGSFFGKLETLLPQAHQKATCEPVAGLVDWRREFCWSPLPVAYATRSNARLIRGALTEIYQRALSEPLDGLSPLLTPSQIDGLPGPATDKAIVEFKKRNGLRLGRAAQHAVVGKETWDTLVQMPVDWKKP